MIFTAFTSSKPEFLEEHMEMILVAFHGNNLNVESICYLSHLCFRNRGLPVIHVHNVIIELAQPVFSFYLIFSIMKEFGFSGPRENRPEARYTKRLKTVKTIEGRYQIRSPRRKTIPITMNAATSTSIHKETRGKAEGPA